MDNLQTQIENLRTLQESYDAVAQAAEAYNVGKIQLAQAITSKGVETSPTESYPEMAEKVNAISQETYQINGGEMYAMQLFGSLETPNYWNLYEVLASLLSDGRLVSYGGILLAEYRRGYDSLALSGAGAGGAYVVSDLDENGWFKMYTEDTTHVWATEFDGKGDRWVAYCFHDEYHDFQITDTNTSPRSIFIGRKVGTITLLTNTRTSNIVVPNGNNLRTYLSGSYTTNWNPSIILYLDEMPNGNLLYNYSNSAGKVYLSVANATNRIINFTNLTLDTLVIVSGSTFSSRFVETTITNVFIKAESFSYWSNNVNHMLGGRNAMFANLTLIDIESWGGGLIHSNTPGVTKKLTLLYKTNDKTKSIYFGRDYNNHATDVELKDGWCKPLSIVCFQNLTKENVQAHIFDRLGVNDISTGAVTITLASAVLNLFTQEEIDVVVARTNITIVGA